MIRACIRAAVCSLLVVCQCGAVGNASTDKINWIEPDGLMQKLEERKEKKTFFHLIDLRTEKDYRESHVSGAVNIPYSKLVFVMEKLLRKIDQIVLYSYSAKDKISVNAAILLTNRGYASVSVLRGGLYYWRGDVEKEKS